MLRALFPLFLLAVQGPVVSLSPEQRSKVTHTTSIKMNVGGTDVTVDFDAETTFTTVTDTDITTEQASSNLKVMVNGAEMPVPSNSLKVVIGKDGSIKEIGGGLPGADAIYNHLLFRFVPAPTEEGKKLTIDIKGDSAKGIPDQTVSSTYVGPKKVGEVDGYEFEQTTKANDFTTTTDFVVKADGTILEANAKFSGLPIPAANGLGAEGTATMKIRG